MIDNILWFFGGVAFTFVYALFGVGFDVVAGRADGARYGLVNVFLWPWGLIAFALEG